MCSSPVYCWELDLAWPEGRATQFPQQNKPSKFKNLVLEGLARTARHLDWTLAVKLGVEVPTNMPGTGMGLHQSTPLVF